MISASLVHLEEPRSIPWSLIRPVNWSFVRRPKKRARFAVIGGGARAVVVGAGAVVGGAGAVGGGDGAVVGGGGPGAVVGGGVPGRPARRRRHQVHPTHPREKPTKKQATPTKYASSFKTTSITALVLAPW